MTNTVIKGVSLHRADKVAILIHGRGASAESILTLSDHLNLKGFALLAPQAEGSTWYPYSFMAPEAQNEPAYTKAISTIDALVKGCQKEGINPEKLYFIGFSQGACLTLEYAALHARKYGGVIAFTGGLIGEIINADKYKGDFAETPVFIGSSNRDMHVPLSRIKTTADLLRKLGANVNTLIFDDPQHTIRQEEIDWVNQHIL
ncbi:alpha/beta hydrolase [Anditalea andensis]|uniref:Phospholipase n=1 Tax=Anditalea andensis TaxID=1048983 RepID=A0A074LI01_9BACT|nr:dienelactone hydrolase family protein [Anditalea andensis]KEO73427.1 phospholipase [Anditalea andensis]